MKSKIFFSLLTAFCLAGAMVLCGCSNKTKDRGKIKGHEWVDLGLSVKWATCNVGASAPSDYGNYYAWGETRTKSEYTEENSVTSGKNIGNIAGNPTYDAATANWGSSWRLPTHEEIDELENKCTWEWVTQGETNGYKVTGPNGNSIFLPAAGWRNGTLPQDAGDLGGYWSATPDENSTSCAYKLFFFSGYGMNWCNRSIGRSVRPVSGEVPSVPTTNPNNTANNRNTSPSSTSSSSTTQQAQISQPTGTINGRGYVDLGLSVKWATYNVGAYGPSDYGNYYAWGETKPKAKYTEENSVTYGREMGSIAGNPTYDAATANWGRTWRLPTEDEIDELTYVCKWEWTTLNGHEGYKVTGTNGNSIFLPAAGWRDGTSLNFAGGLGAYWSATPYRDCTNDAIRLPFDEVFIGRYVWNVRYGGQSVRPVSE